MKSLRVWIAVAVCMATGAVPAFDARAWAAKNDVMAKEAVRMKSEYEMYAAKAVNPAENVTVPIETFDSGDVKAVVVAKQGKFFNDFGYVWAKDITVEQYEDDGSVDLRMEAESCLVDRKSRCCWASGRVTVYHRKTVLEGVDAFYCSSNTFLKVMSDVKVVSEDVKMKGLAL